MIQYIMNRGRAQNSHIKDMIENDIKKDDYNIAW